MILRTALTALVLVCGASLALAQDNTITVPANAVTPPAPAPATDAEVDTSFRPSPSISARIQREFLSRIRWSAGVEARDELKTAFDERSPSEIWSDLVAKDGLKPTNVVDTLTAYWVLNWVTANGAYGTKVDNAPIQRQLRAAFATDPNFLKLNEQDRQRLAEGYILNFLIEHAALNKAVESRDTAALRGLGLAAIARFQRTMGVNLLELQPGPQGFVGRSKSEQDKAAPAAPAAPTTPAQ